MHIRTSIWLPMCHIRWGLPQKLLDWSHWELLKVKLDADKKSGMDDPDLELIKARKMKKLQEQLDSKEKDKINLELQNKTNKNKPEGIDSERNFLLRYL